MMRKQIFIGAVVSVALCAGFVLASRSDGKALTRAEMSSITGSACDCQGTTKYMPPDMDDADGYLECKNQTVALPNKKLITNGTSWRQCFAGNQSICAYAGLVTAYREYNQLQSSVISDFACRLDNTGCYSETGTTCAWSKYVWSPITKTVEDWYCPGFGN